MAIWSGGLIVVGGALTGVQQFDGPMPINKNLWTLSYTFFTAGLGFIARVQNSLIRTLVKYDFSKIEILLKNSNFGQKFKCSSKIQILVKNSNVRQKFKFWSKIQMFVKNSNVGQK